MNARLYCLIALSVFFSFFGSQFAYTQERVFFGNLHSHTSYGTPREAFQYARNTAGIHFLALTEHNHAEAVGNDGISIATNNALYKGAGSDSLISAARSLIVDGQFVALLGLGFSTSRAAGRQIDVF